MVACADVQFLGRRSGTSARGPWYQISFMSEGQPLEMRSDPDAFSRCDGLKLGDEMKVYVSIRRYQNDWLPRIENIEY